MKYFLVLLFSAILFSARAQSPPFMDKIPQEGLMEALEYYEIHHKEIVYAQAVIESSNFKSRLCKNNNNIFGLKCKKRYCRYNHWSECVIDYKKRIQNRYRSGEDYYHFLRRIRYASDPNYIKSLKRIVKKK